MPRYVIFSHLAVSSDTKEKIKIQYKKTKYSHRKHAKNTMRLLSERKSINLNLEQLHDILNGKYPLKEWIKVEVLNFKMIK